ncbi:MAG: WYL domain-containing protein [Flavobacteriales bacterium]
MPANRNALIRYKTIDQCLQNRYRKWTLEDLIEVCSDTLYEYEGIDKGISRRTIQMDIQMMRSEKLGYNAPIVVLDKKYYTYEDPSYSITNIPLTNQDLSKLSETVEILRQFKGFSHFQELDGMVQKLEDHIHSAKTKKHTVIHIEKNENLKGLEFLDELYQSVVQQRCIHLTYQSFKARQANSFNFHPYHLKEFRNRWFVIGVKRKGDVVMNLALDRIIGIEDGDLPYYRDEDFDAEKYFEHVIGVSVSPTLAPIHVHLYVTHVHAPYIITKPLHKSQQIINRDNFGMTISIKVQHNFELEKEILSYGDGVKVLSPPSLRRNILERVNGALDLYKTELSESGLKATVQKLEHKGYDILNFVYTKREIKKIGGLLDAYLKKNPAKTFARRKLLQSIPELKAVLFNKNLKEIIHAIDPKAFLCKAIYFDKPLDANWYVTWHQDVPINVDKKMSIAGYSCWTNKEGVIGVRPPEEVSKSVFSMRIHLDDTDESNGALKIVPGSQNKILSAPEIELITTNSIPKICVVPAGGIQLMKPLVLHASSKSTSQKRRRVIHLEFTSRELPRGLEWEEKMLLL